MLALAVHGPATATLHVGQHRLLLGTADAPAGDPIAIVLARTCVEEAARLPTILRNHGSRQQRPTIVTGDPRRLNEMLHDDEVCMATVHGEPKQLSLESYVGVTPVPPVEPGKPHTSLGIYQAPGLGVFVDRCNWMRTGDALRTWIYRWDQDGEHDEQIQQALFKGDTAAMAAINKLEEAVTEELGKVGARVRAGEKVNPADVPKPVMTRYLWAPYCREAGLGFAHMTLTLRRSPFDAGSLQQRAAINQSRCIEDYIGKEISL